MSETEHICRDCDSCGCECTEPCAQPWPCYCDDEEPDRG